ncbi:DUF2382 domain-containing protein [Nostoc sp. PCC 7107]|uniref:DUF2382 domain-containing protein n=1 Tax=Nostoc sp. PCC 7107 TaxID=317936 RepID=UPI00029ED810|nr:DUF2382 domain-containing protein [Nostoc sp. PCC 7107]AFY42619.1 protein of unknown function DUF2382-containing protein [Nostoc sp. PCC 7107]
MINNIEHINQKPSINNLLATLKIKVAGFDVIDNQGQLVGKVKDLILDNQRQLNLVISQQVNIIQKSEQPVIKEKLAVVWSQKIQKIDTISKSIFLNIDTAAIEYMPEDLKHQIIGYQVLSDNTNEKLVQAKIENSSMETANLEEFSEETIVRLLEEKLVVDSGIHKIGEVIVRKEIETRMIQVPVRREKLIVEQVSPQHKQLAEIDLGLEEISEIALTDAGSTAGSSFASDLAVSGEFSSPKIASLLLNAIALEKNHGCQRVRVSILCEDESLKHKYQEWFDRCSQGQQDKFV